VRETGVAVSAPKPLPPPPAPVPPRERDVEMYWLDAGHLAAWGEWQRQREERA